MASLYDFTAALLDAVGVIKVVVSLAAGLVSVGQEVFPAVVTCALCCLCLPELAWGRWRCCGSARWVSHKATHTGDMPCSSDPP